MNKTNFDIKLNPHFKLYISLKDKIRFERELKNNGIRYFSNLEEQPLIDSGIRYFLLDSDSDKINKILVDNGIIATTESQLVFDYRDENKRLKIYFYVALTVIGILAIIMLIEQVII